MNAEQIIRRHKDNVSRNKDDEKARYVAQLYYFEILRKCPRKSA